MLSTALRFTKCCFVPLLAWPRLIGATPGAVEVPRALFCQLPEGKQEELAPVNPVTGKREAPRAQCYLTGHHGMTLKQAIRRFAVRWCARR